MYNYNKKNNNDNNNYDYDNILYICFTLYVLMYFNLYTYIYLNTDFNYVEFLYNCKLVSKKIRFNYFPKSF